MKRLLVAAATIAALVVPAVPALAQTGGSTSISGISNGQAISGSATVRGHATANTGSNVRHLEITIDGNVVRSADYDGLKDSATLEYGWNTSAGRNGEYAVTVKANFSGGGSDSTTYKVKVDNAPQAVSGVTANYTGSEVVISWNANPEADITGYVVERDGGAGWASVGRTEGTSMTDNPGAGSFNYRVTALRYSPTQGEKASSPSGAASVSVPQTSSGGSDESGSGSGSGSGGGYYQGGGSGNGGYYQGGGGNGNNNNGGSVPGYYGNNGGKGSKGGKNGTSGSPWGNYGFSSGGLIGNIGLPGRLALPGSNTPLSPGTQDGIDWGNYEPTLPYDLSGSGSAFPAEFLGGEGRTAAQNDYTVIPPDGLRWVAAGLWFLVAAALMKFLERKLAASEAAAAAGVDEGKGVKGVAEAARKISLRELLSDEPVAQTAEDAASTVVETPKDGDAVSFKTTGKKRRLRIVKDDAA